MKKILSILLVLAMSISMLAVPVLAVDNSNFELNASNTNVTVDGTADKIVNVVFSSKTAMTVTGVEGTFTDDSEYLSLTDYVSPVTLSGTNGFSIGTGKVVYFDDMSFTGYNVAANENIMTAVYTVDRNAPTGEYSVTFKMIDVMDGNFESTTSANYTVTINVTNTSAPVDPPSTDGYTVTIADAVSGTAEVEVGDTVTMNIAVDKTVNGIEAYVIYDKALFSCDADTDADGKIYVQKLENTPFTDAGTLTFIAKAIGTGSFGFESAVVGGYEDFTSNAVEANKVTDAVKVNAKTYAVSIANIANGSVSVKDDKTAFAAGETVELIVAPTEGYQLKSLTYTAEGGTAVAIEGNEFVMPAANVTVNAEFELIPAATYTITVPNVDNATVTVTVGNETYEEGEEIEGLTEGDEFIVNAVAAEDYEITDIQVLSNGSELTGKDSVYTVANGNITIEVTVAEKALDVTISTSDYVNGYKLVTVTGTNANGYTYDGKAMIKIATDKYAYLTNAADASKVAKNTTGAVCGDITDDVKYDVNGTRKVDFYDAGAAFGCSNTAYTVADNMEMYLRADVDTDGDVDAADVNVILQNYTK